MSGRGWLEGTMDVISGSITGSSSADSGSQHGSSGSLRGKTVNSRTGRASSTPRPRAMTPPRIDRMPSHESMNRSLHNNSSHGKSSAQIIKELRASNTALSEKTAEMEYDFMNQISTLSNSMKDQTEQYEETIKRKDQQISNFETRVMSAEKRIRERDAQLAQVKEESAFSRHTISDLKNQLYQLQHEVEEAEFDKQDEVEKWEAKEREYNVEIERLKRERDSALLKAEESRQRPEDDGSSRSIETEEISKAEQANEGNHMKGLGTPPKHPFKLERSKSTEIRETWKQLEDAQEALAESEGRLHETQSALANLENENRRLVKEHEVEVEHLKEDMDRLQKDLDEANTNRKREELDHKVKSEIADTSAEREAEKLWSQVEERDETITNLRGTVTELESRVESLNCDLDALRSDRDKSREDYVKEIEQLRSTNDSQKKEIEHQTSELETLTASVEHMEKLRSMNELQREEIEHQSSRFKSLTESIEKMEKLQTTNESQKEEIERQAFKLKKLTEKMKQDEQELKERATDFDDQSSFLDQKIKALNDTTKRNTALANQIEELQNKITTLECDNEKMKVDSRNTTIDLEHRCDETQKQFAKLEQTHKDTTAEHENTVADLQEEIAGLRSVLSDAESRSKRRIVALENERDSLLTELESAQSDLEACVKREQAARDLEKEEESEAVRQLKDEVAKIVAERAKMEKSFAKQLANLESSKHMVVMELEEKLREKEEMAEQCRQVAKENERKVHLIHIELEDLTIESKKQVEAKQKEIEEMREEMEGKEAKADNERRDVTVAKYKLEERTKELETKIDETEQELAAMKTKVEEIEKESESRSTQLGERNAEVERLKKEVETMEAKTSHSSKLKKQLRAAQMALVALDDEKKAAIKSAEEELVEVKSDLARAKQNLAGMEEKYRETVDTMEAEHDDLERVHSAKIVESEKETSELRDRVAFQEEAATKLLAELKEAQAEMRSEAERYEGQIAKLRETASKHEGEGMIRIAELEEQIDSLKTQLDAKERELNEMRETLEAAKQAAQAPRSLTRSVANGSNMKGTGRIMEQKLRIELANAKATEKKLSDRIAHLESEQELALSELREKLDDRDTTISALVKSSVTQEAKLAEALLDRQRTEARLAVHGDFDAEELARYQNMEAMQLAREAEWNEEMESLRATLEESKESEKELKKDLCAARNDLAALEADHERTTNELRATKTGDEGDAAESKQLRQRIAAMDEERRMLEEDHQKNLTERDGAIATLVKASIAQEEQVTALQSEVDELRRDNGGGRPGPSWDELRRLQQESEIFAGQVIEQDEEMEDLKKDIQERDAKNASLLREVSSLRKKVTTLERDSKRVADLEAELDEVQDVNTNLREDLRDLRQKVKEMQNDSDLVSGLRVQLEEAKVALAAANAAKVQIRGFERDEMIEADLRTELENAIASRDALEERLTRQINSLRRLKNNSSEELEVKLQESEKKFEAMIEELEVRVQQRDSTLQERDAAMRERDVLISSMKEASSSLESEVSSLRAQVNELRKDLEEQSLAAETAQTSLKNMKQALDVKSSAEEKYKVELDKETKAIISTNESLSEEVKRLQEELEAVGDVKNIKKLKAELKQSEKSRAEFEKSIIATYERKMSLMKLNKDVEIDSLRKTLTESKGKSSDSEGEMLHKIHELEEANRDLNEEMQAKLQHKNAKILALEQTLDAQQQVVGHMRAEMDQLQTSMERSTLTRRAEIEEMQQEVMDGSAKAAKQERELTALKMKLEERKMRHKSEVVKLKETIKALETETPMQRGIQAERDDRRLEDMTDKLEDLKWQNASMREENTKLRERLEKAEAVGKASKNDKWRLEEMADKLEQMKWQNSSMQEENIKLRNRLERARGASLQGNNNFTSEKKALEEQVAYLSKRVHELEGGSSTAATTSNSTLPPSRPKGSKEGSRDRKTSSPLRQRLSVPSPRRGKGFSLRMRHGSKERPAMSENPPEGSTGDKSSETSVHSKFNF